MYSAGTLVAVRLLGAPGVAVPDVTHRSRAGLALSTARSARTGTVWWSDPVTRQDHHAPRPHPWPRVGHSSTLDEPTQHRPPWCQRRAAGKHSSGAAAGGR